MVFKKLHNQGNNPGKTKYQEKSPAIIKKKSLKKTLFHEIGSVE